jgi:VWFA-related protein
MSWRIEMSVVSLVLLAAGSIAAQAPTSAQAQTAGKPPVGKEVQTLAAIPPTPTFKSNTRLVLVDVVVTDRNGQPVHDLKKQDFTVVEDGKPQRVVAFEEQRPDRTPKVQAPALNLPKNVYTNFVSRTGPGALTVLLFDSLNTDRMSLTYARNEMLNVLKNLAPGKKVALFTLSERLQMVQSFTDNTDALIALATQLSTKPHAAYSNSREFSATVGEMKEAGFAKNPQAFHNFVQFFGEDYVAKLEARTQDTLDALNLLARSLAVVPGRKNLIWISSGFPFDITTNAPQLQKTAALLAATRIAVYPVDVRGVMTMTADGSTRDSEIFAPVQTQSYETLSGVDAENASIVETFLNTAKLTGGKAYINKNDLQSAINDGMQTGSHYYSLAYRPDNINWNGKFRKISVKSSRPNLKLLYRSGYYGILDPLSTKEDPSRVVATAMQPTVPVSTQLIMKARVVPPEEPGKPTAIDMLIDVRDLVFNESADKQRTPEVQFVTIAWDSHGKQVAGFSEGFKAPQSPAQMQSLLRTGLQFHQDLLVKPGSYQLRLGVMDRLSGRIGTLDVPLTIEAKVAAK